MIVKVSLVIVPRELANGAMSVVRGVSRSCDLAVLNCPCFQVDDNASEDEIKSAYRQLAKICHPDNAGDKGHNICILLNEVRQPP